MSTRVPSGVDQYTSVSASRDGRRIVATVANPASSLWQVPLLDRRRRANRDAEPYKLPVPTGMALAPRFGQEALFYLSARGSRDGLWKVRDGKGVGGSEGRGRGAVRAAGGVAGRTRLAVVVRRRASGTCQSCRRTARPANAGPVHRSRGGGRSRGR